MEQAREYATSALEAEPGNQAAQQLMLWSDLAAGHSSEALETLKREVKLLASKQELKARWIG